MAKMLKVYRTVSGFYDAYVASTTKKAALEAWGSKRNLFGDGEAEIVVDKALTAEPLANPGKVVKRLRGTAAEQVVALDEASGKGKAKVKAEPAKTARARPSRAKLDAAEAALAALERDQKVELDAIARDEQRLADRRLALVETQREATARLEAKRVKQAANYDEAIGVWRAS